MTVPARIGRTPIKVFLSKDEFYNRGMDMRHRVNMARGEKRTRSPELDFGVWWRGERPWPTYRVSWVEATGEIYATDSRSELIDVLGVVNGREEIEDVLQGWADVCGKERSLYWVKDRIKKYG